MLERRCWGSVSGLVPAGQLRFEFPDPGLGRQPSFPFAFEGGDFLTGLRVVPTELTVLPSDEQVQHGAMALQDAFLRFLAQDDGLLYLSSWTILLLAHLSTCLSAGADGGARGCGCL